MSAANANAPAGDPSGIVRAGDGAYCFDFGTLQQIKAGEAYSSAFGGCVAGERMMVALLRMPKGTGSDLHSHPNEQWIYMLEGKMEFIIDGQPTTAKPGSLIYIPANVIHNASVTSDEDVVFFTVKDTSHGLVGTKV